MTDPKLTPKLTPDSTKTDVPVGVVEGCSRVFIPRESGVLRMDRICYCGYPGGHAPPHVCLECGGKWGEAETAAVTTAFVLEAIRPGSGLWFWDCPVCPDARGPDVLTKTEAKHGGREHDRACHRKES